MSHLSDKRSALMGLEFVNDTLYRLHLHEMNEAKECLQGLLKMREDELQLATNYKKASLFVFVLVWLFFPDAVCVYCICVIYAFPEIAICVPPYFLSNTGTPGG